MKTMKTVNTIYETSEYDLFKGHALNRVEKAKPEILRSLEQDGFWDAHPIHVVKKWNHYVIKEGHHRFAAAKQLGIPVKFVITEEDGKLPQEYIPETRWTPRDIMVSYSDAGNKHYKYLRKYVRTYGLPVHVAMCILAKRKESERGCGRSNAYGFRNGKLEIQNYALGEKVGEVIAHCANIVPYAKSKLFSGAIAAACKLEGFDPERFMSKMTSHGQLMDKQPDIMSYIAEFERIYNRNCRRGDIVPLSVFYRN